MKKLFTIISVISALTVIAQNQQTNVTKSTSFNSILLEPVSNNYNGTNMLNNSNNTNSIGNLKRIGGSSNVLSVSNTKTNALNYLPETNIIGMGFRKHANWTGITNGNSGTIIYAWSTNNGFGFDSTVMLAHATNLGRYPASAIYNPNGNTNPINAIAVISGAVLNSTTSQFNGAFFVSKNLTIPGNNSNGNFVYSLNNTLTPIQRKQDFAFENPQITADGKFHVLGRLMENASAATGWRGAMLNTGIYNAGSFTWTLDSLKPSFKVDSNGLPIGYQYPQQAWSENGQIGYVIFTGVDVNAQSTTPQNAVNPYVYKTTNAGVTWNRYTPLMDFNSIPVISNRTIPSNIGIQKPFFSLNEGADATVDANGDLHVLYTIKSSASDLLDNLTLTHSVNYSNVWDYIIDLKTVSTNTNVGWCAIVIDSLNTAAPTATQSPWASTGYLNVYDARLQISRTRDGNKIFYSWCDSDTSITGNRINTQPDIYMVGYDIQTNTRTTTKDMSVTKTGLEYDSFWFLTSPIIKEINSTTFLIPTSISKNSTKNADSYVDHYYIDDNIFTSSEFNIPVSCSNGLYRIAGDVNNNGSIDGTEVAGDANVDGVISSGELAGDLNGDGVIDGTELTGDANGNGIIDNGELAGDANGNGTIDGTEITGDVNGNGVIDGNETAGDTNGNGTMGVGETSGDINGDGAIGTGEISGDTNGDGAIGTGELPGDTNGNGIIDGTEIYGDTNGNGVLDGSEITALAYFNSTPFTINVYPNPNNGNFHIDLKSKTSIKILNVIGQIVYENELESGSHPISIMNFATGTYILKASNETESKIIRLFKN